MRLYDDDMWRKTDISQMPDLFQCNGEPVNPRLRQYIFEGDPCEYDETLRAAMKKHTFRDRFVNIFVIALLLFLIICTVRGVYKIGGEMSVPLFVSISAIIILITCFACREYTNNAAVKAADRGEARCFGYTFYGIYQYETYDPDDGTTRYYFAKLGEFFVKVSSDKSFPPRVFGLVVSVKGTEHFYLLV